MHMKTHTRDSLPDASSPRSLVVVLKSHTPKIIAISVLVGLATFGAFSLDTGVYTSRVDLRIGGPQAGQAGTPLSNLEKEIVAREMRALQSRDLALAVVSDLQLENAAAFTSNTGSMSLSSRALSLVFPAKEIAPAGETQEERVLRRFTRALHVSNEPGSNRVMVAISFADGDLAARAANRLVEFYGIRTRDRPRAPITQDVGWLMAEIQNRTRDLDKAEALASLSRQQMEAGAKPPSAKESAAQGDAVKTKRAQLEKLHANLTAIQARTEALSQPVTVEIISRATPASRKTILERVMSASLATSASLMIGLALAAAFELMGRAKRSDARPSQHASSVFNEPRVDARPGLPSTSRSQGVRTHTLIDDLESATFDRPYEPSERLGQFTRCRSIGGVVRRLIDDTHTQGGYRSIIVSEVPGQDVREEATDLAAALCAAGKQVALVDWSLDGVGIARALGIRSKPGFMDLVEDRASFDEVIQRLPDGDAHVLPCGSPQAGGTLDTERLNLVLDTLDEVYDHIVVTGTDEAIRVLFLSIGGRFDACIAVGDTRPEGRRVEPESETFLGYHVTDIDLIRLETTGPERVRAPMQARRQDSAEARV